MGRGHAHRGFGVRSGVAVVALVAAGLGAVGTDALSAAPVKGPGIGTEAALDAPGCDPDTGRIAIPFVLAPECAVPFADGASNGGTTSQGVTGETIRVVNYYTTPFTGPTDAAAAQRKTVEEMPAVYQQFYETWGRTVEFSFVQASGSDETSARADAVSIMAMKPFAVIVAGAARTLVTELAAARIVVITSDATHEMLQSLAPYVWSSAFTDSKGFMNSMIEYAGKRLVGRRARWAQDDELSTSTRVIGLVHGDTWPGDEFARGLAKYEGTVAVDQLLSTDTSAQSTQAPTIVSKLKTAGVTTVIVAAGFGVTGELAAQATAQDYHPEWIITGTLGQDVAIVARNIDQEQWKAAFGISNLTVPSTSSGTRVLHEWYWGNSDSYQSLFNGVIPILFTGIHYAGPRLTPKTFAAGLFSAAPAGGVSCGCVLSQQVSFGKSARLGFDDYSSWDDFTEVWWDPTAEGTSIGSTVVGIGNYRYPAGGKRYLVGQWPRSEPKVFDPDTAVLRYDTPPANDALPRYECEGCPSTS